MCVCGMFGLLMDACSCIDFSLGVPLALYVPVAALLA